MIGFFHIQANAGEAGQRACRAVGNGQDGIAALMHEEAVYAHRFSGKRYDCGSKLGYLQATVEYALAHPQLGKDFRSYLASMPRLKSARGRRL